MYTYICIYTIHTYIHTYIRTYVHTYIRTYVHAYMHTCIHTYMHACIHTYMHACMHTYVHTYTHIYIYIYIHVHIYTYTRWEMRNTNIYERLLETSGRCSKHGPPASFSVWAGHVRTCFFWHGMSLPNAHHAFWESRAESVADEWHDQQQCEIKSFEV